MPHSIHRPPALRLTESTQSRCSPGTVSTPPGLPRLQFDHIDAPRITHHLFRFPAKFHPPVAHALLRRYTESGQTVLDPFCGSGTLLLAASLEKRHAIGYDVDPVAVFVTAVKTHRLEPRSLRSSWAELRPRIESAARPNCEYTDLRFSDITSAEYKNMLSREHLWTPNIPNLLHWFRKYVIIDLARLRTIIISSSIPLDHRDFFLLIFAAIIRNSSNADPVPVSGLEVTSYMRKRDAKGRTINPFAIFHTACERGIVAAEDYWIASSPHHDLSVIQADTSPHYASRREDVMANVA